MKTNVRKCSYTVLLALSFVLAAGAWKAGYINAGQEGIAFEMPGFIRQIADGVRGESGAPKAGEAAGTRPGQGVPESGPGQSPAEPGAAAGPGAGEETGTQPGQPVPASLTEETQPEPVREPVMYEADISWFDDALFIGDSRTVGLFEYGNLGNAEVVADSGMSVYKIFKRKFTLSTGEKGTLEELLSQKQFGKIYLMLGINELGYSFDATVSRYTEMVEKIQKLQPDALIFLEGNLHIAKKKSDSSPVYNNANINRFNEAVAGLADDRTRFYLDVNELFDDEEGNLADNYTADDAHVLGIYYSDWVDWILKHAVAFQEVEPVGDNS